jgi:hypothetical protein
VELAAKHIVFQVVDVLADVKWSLTFDVATQTNAFSSTAWLQKAVIVVSSATGCNNAMSATVYLFHPLSLSHEVATWALNHAK